MTLLLIVILALAFFFLIRGSGNTDMYPDVSNGQNNGQNTELANGVDYGPNAVSGAINEPLKQNVEEFGKQLRFVSLLSPKPTLAKDIDYYYSSFVDSRLIAKWKANPLSTTTPALGKKTSSPWPQRIDVVSMRDATEADLARLGADMKTYIYDPQVVEVNIIEVVGTDSKNDPAAVQPATLLMTKTPTDSGRWYVFDVQLGFYSTLPQRQTLEGEYICLPHKNTDGPQTMECAFGLKTTSGNYALNAMLMSSDILTRISTGTRIRVEGTVTPVEALSSNTWQKYDIKGIMSVTSARVL